MRDGKLFFAAYTHMSENSKNIPHTAYCARTYTRSLTHTHTQHIKKNMSRMSPALRVPDALSKRISKETSVMELIAVCDSKTNTAPDFPIGWWSVARSHELKPGDVTSVTALDRELVVYRTESGEARVHDAFCPHLGAHLGVNGKVVGESIQCPFHGWQFGGDGKCNKIPYCDTIPTRAKVQNWPTSEVNGEIYMWFHPTGAEPDREVPVIEQIGDENWTEPRQVEFNIPVHIQDIAENSCDPEHFQYVHKQNQTPPSSVEVEDDGAVHLRSEIEAQGMKGGLHATMFQPGLARGGFLLLLRDVSVRPCSLSV